MTRLERRHLFRKQLILRKLLVMAHGLPVDTHRLLTRAVQMPLYWPRPNSRVTRGHLRHRRIELRELHIRQPTGPQATPGSGSRSVSFPTPHFHGNDSFRVSDHPGIGVPAYTAALREYCSLRPVITK